jgi:hypothetical protein
MSADRWSVCPKCLKNEQERAKKAYQKSIDFYGSLPIEEFDKMRKDAEEKDLDSNLGEYWEIYITKEGYLMIDYSCYCDYCKFRFAYKKEINVFEEKNVN